MAAKMYHQESVATNRLRSRLAQIHARRYHKRADNGDTVYQSPHGWITVGRSARGYTLKYWQGCPC